MRCKAIMLLLIFISTVFMSSCQVGSVSKNEESQNGNEILSRGIQLNVAKALSDEASTEKPAVKAVNDSGMSGAESTVHVHNNEKTAKSMWLTKDNVGDKNWITFDFGKIEPVGEMYVWNFNQQDKVNAGLKDVKIFYSVDGENWTDLHEKSKTFRFAKATGDKKLQATNLDGSGKPVEFHGVSARYVKIIPEKEVNKGNWGYYEEKEVRFGLSEVRFFRYKNKAVYDGHLIADVVVKDEKDVMKSNLVNGYGLSDVDQREAIHTNDPKTMWITDGPAEEREILIDLDGTYAIKDMVIWNYNEKGREDAGLKNVKIYYSIDKTEWLKLGDGAVYQFKKADGSDQLKATNLRNGEPVNFNGTVLRYVKLVPQEENGNWGNEKYFGLSKVRFYADEGMAAEPAREWTGLVSNFNGWIGADGIYTISLDGNDTYASANEKTKNMFIFSDTAIGTADPVTKSIPSFGMTNHTMAFLEGNKPDLSKFEFVLTHEKGGNLFRYKAWLGDLIAIGDKIHIPAYVPDEFWNATQYDLITIPIVDGKPDLNHFTKKEKIPAMYVDDEATITMYSGVMDNTELSNPVNPDGYVYIYGIITWSNRDRRLVTARVKKEDYADHSKWTYWTGTTWGNDIKDLKTRKSSLGDAHVSCELSVSPITEGKNKGKYILCYTRDTMSAELEYAIGDTPLGPFNNPVHFYHCEDTKLINIKDVYMYNAKAHPHISAKGELLVSYNVNTPSMALVNSNVNAVHPRFVRLYEIKKQE